MRPAIAVNLDTTRIQLEALLSEPLHVAQARADVFLDLRLGTIENPKKIALFGAGNVGRETARRLRQVGVEPVAFLDDTPSKQGTAIDGIPVLSQTAGIKKYESDLAIAVTILNPAHNFKDTEDRISALYEIMPISFMGLSWRYASAFDGMHGIMPPVDLLAHKDAILAAYDLLVDDKSRNEFMRQIEFRLTLDFSVLTPKETPAYFPGDVPLGLKKSSFVFIDAGAYDGDTIQSLCNHTDKAQKIIAFEPDPQNFIRLKQRVDDLGISAKAELHQAALGAEDGELRFNATGDMSAAFDDAGSHCVPVFTLAPFLKGGPTPCYIKFDIEGAESATLQSAADAVKEAKPLMAISVYHRATDLWRIMLDLHTLNPEYKFYLRNHGIDATDVICYAVP